MWSDDPESFGDLEVTTSSGLSGLVQIRCSCGSDCAGIAKPNKTKSNKNKTNDKKNEQQHHSLSYFLSHSLPSEPILIKIIGTTEDTTVIFYALFTPPPVLPPQGGECRAIFETVTGGAVGGGNEAVSAFSFVVVNCGGWEYVDGGEGVVAQRVYYEVLDEGEGEVLNPLEYPSKRNSLLFFFFFSFLSHFFSLLLSYSHSHQLMGQSNSFSHVGQFESVSKYLAMVQHIITLLLLLLEI